MSTATSPPLSLPQPSSSTSTRRVPPPCWTKEETLALIEAYKDKWFALRRGNLKASDWDAVSEAVCSVSDPGTVKSSVQCRHKIEKLRKRYRAEKQRCLKNSGKFSSSWDLYPLLDSMNFASTSVAGSDDQDHVVDQKVSVFNGGFCLKSRKRENIDGNSGSNLGFDHEFRGGYDSSFNFDHKLGSGYGVKWHENGDFVAKGTKKFKGNGRTGDGYASMIDFDQDVDSLGEFPLKTFGDRSFLNVGFKPKNYGSPYLNYDYDNDSSEYSIDDDEMVFRARDSGHWDSVPQGFHQKKWGRVDRNFEPGSDTRGLNGVASCSRPGLERKNAAAGLKKGVDPVDEMASSIKMLAEGFVRMEKMKMEMVKEIETMRMEMEMKHNEMILESQQKIVGAISSALLSEKKKRKKKPSSMFSNTKGNEAEEWQEDALTEKERYYNSMKLALLLQAYNSIQISL